MKEYKNKEGVVMTAPEYVTIDGVVFKATDTILKEVMGWTIEDVADPVVEPTAEELYVQKKADKLAEIEAYDNSSEVNGFVYKGKQLWIDKATRVGLMNAVDSAVLMGNEEITFGMAGLSVTMECGVAKQMLAALEMYALGCYNVTLGHKMAVEAMPNMAEDEETDWEALVAEIDGYDVKVGYPDMLVFE